LKLSPEWQAEYGGHVLRYAGYTTSEAEQLDSFLIIPIQTVTHIGELIIQDTLHLFYREFRFPSHFASKGTLGAMVFNFFANATESVSWVPNPTNRGTSNILQSCLITTSLCVWTALHLNVKEHDDPTFLRISYQTWRKAGWLIIGLLAPEMVVYTAWYQRSEAKDLRDIYNKKFGLKLPPGKLKRAYRWLFHRQGKESTNAMGHEFRLARMAIELELEAAQNHKQTAAIARHDKIPWTLAQGFYAQMGGFALDTIGAYPEFLPETLTTLDESAFNTLLREENLPVLVGATFQDTTHENDGTDERPSSQRHSSHREEEPEFDSNR
jgi:hypothetical protein